MSNVDLDLLVMCDVSAKKDVTPVRLQWSYKCLSYTDPLI